MKRNCFVTKKRIVKVLVWCFYIAALIISIAALVRSEKKKEEAEHTYTYVFEEMPYTLIQNEPIGFLPQENLNETGTMTQVEVTDTYEWME